MDDFLKRILMGPEQGGPFVLMDPRPEKPGQRKPASRGPASEPGFQPAPALSKAFPKPSSPDIAQAILSGLAGREKVPLSEDEFQSMMNRTTPELTSQAAGLGAFEDAAKKPSALNPFLAAAAGFSDIFAGTNAVGTLSSSEAKKQENYLAALDKLQKARDSVTENKLKLFKEQFQPVDPKRFGMGAAGGGGTGGGNPYGSKPSRGMVEFDADYAKFLADWATKSKPLAQANLTALTEALNIVKANPKITGEVEDTMDIKPGDKLYPAYRLAKTKQFYVKSLIDSVTIEQLTARLGAQFTQTEGTEFKALEFDKSATPSENMKKLERRIEIIQNAISRNDQAFSQFMGDKGTMFKTPKKKTTGQTPEKTALIEEYKRLLEEKRKFESNNK